jgi:hypothetical protein
MTKQLNPLVFWLRLLQTLPILVVSLAGLEGSETFGRIRI